MRSLPFDRPPERLVWRNRFPVAQFRPNTGRVQTQTQEVSGFGEVRASWLDHDLALPTSGLAYPSDPFGLRKCIRFADIVDPAGSSVVHHRQRDSGRDILDI